MGTSLEKNALEYLMGAYFNQDFVHEYGGLWETLEGFTREDPEVARTVPLLIVETLARFPVDSDLDGYLERAGCDFNTNTYAGGARAWLMEIARRLEAWAERENSGSVEN